MVAYIINVTESVLESVEANRHPPIAASVIQLRWVVCSYVEVLDLDWLTVNDVLAFKHNIILLLSQLVRSSIGIVLSFRG